VLKIVKHLEMTMEALFVCPPDNLQKAILVKVMTLVYMLL